MGAKAWAMFSGGTVVAVTAETADEAERIAFPLLAAKARATDEGLGALVLLVAEGASAGGDDDLYASTEGVAQRLGMVRVGAEGGAR